MQDSKDGQTQVTDIAYHFYRPVVVTEVCNLGHAHRKTVDRTYHVRLQDGSEREISKDEYDSRPR